MSRWQVVAAALILPGLLASGVTWGLLQSEAWRKADIAVSEIAWSLSQLAGTFLSIFVVYIVFKLTFLFQRLEETEETLANPPADIRAVTRTETKYAKLLLRKREYVAPLILPVSLLTVVLIAAIAVAVLAPLVKQQALTATVAVVSLATYAGTGITMAMWAAFTTGIES